MEKTLAVINQLEQAGLIERYAIGGAIAATRYIEPVQTFDLDIFVILPASHSELLSLTPIYAYLSQHGYEPHGEAVMIEEWPVQFLPVYDPLTDEALAQAVEVDFGSTPTRVLSAEYLAAIMLQTGRPKDHARLIQFLEFKVIDQIKLDDIITRHKLTAKWQSFQKRFLHEKD